MGKSGGEFSARLSAEFPFFIFGFFTHGYEFGKFPEVS